MIAKFDIQDTKEATDPGELTALLAMLIGQPVLKASVSYGDEVCLHLGQPIPYRSPAGANIKGEYVIATRASNWVLRTDTFVASNMSLKNCPQTAVDEIVPFVSGQEGHRVVEAVATKIKTKSASVFGLFLRLDNLTTFGIVPSHSERDGDIADWQILAPNSKILKVGPGSKWGLLPSNVPIQ